MDQALTKEAGYDVDFYAWTQRQAEHLRTGRFDALDLPNLIDEVAGLGGSEESELESRLEVLLVHLLKWQVQSDRRGRSWSLTIAEQRRKLDRRLRKSPSLRPRLAAFIEDGYGDALLVAQRETDLPENNFPPTCPYTIDQILSPDFLPSDDTTPPRVKD